VFGRVPPRMPFENMSFAISQVPTADNPGMVSAPERRVRNSHPAGRLWPTAGHCQSATHHCLENIAALIRPIMYSVYPEQRPTPPRFPHQNALSLCTMTASPTRELRMGNDTRSPSRQTASQKASVGGAPNVRAYAYADTAWMPTPERRKDEANGCPSRVFLRFRRSVGPRDGRRVELMINTAAAEKYGSEKTFCPGEAEVEAAS